MSTGKPEVKENVAVEAIGLEDLLRERLNIGESLDAVIDELGEYYGLLAKTDRAIGAAHFARYGVGRNPLWLSETANAELLRNRLAMELAEHSSGGANETVLGPVRSRETLAEVFAKQHEGVKGGGQ